MASFKTPPHPSPVPVYLVLEACLAFNPSPTTPSINTDDYEMSKAAVLGSFAFREMFPVMQRIIKRKQDTKSIHHRVKTESDALALACASFEAFQARWGSSITNPEHACAAKICKQPQKLPRKSQRQTSLVKPSSPRSPCQARTRWGVICPWERLLRGGFLCIPGPLPSLHSTSALMLPCGAALRKHQPRGLCDPKSTAIC